MTKNKPSYLGHRERIKQQFWENSVNVFPDYQLLEIFLWGVIPRKDTKIIAKELLLKFGSLTNIFNASDEKLEEVENISKSAIIYLKTSKEIFNRMAREQVNKQCIINSWSALVNYLKINMGGLKTEQMRILFLDIKNKLIAEEKQEYGTVDATPIYPREVLKRVIYHDASSIILVHNHPSGDTKPSRADIEVTKTIINILKPLNIKVHDHLIVSSSQFYSFKKNNLI